MAGGNELEGFSEQPPQVVWGGMEHAAVVGGGWLRCLMLSELAHGAEAARCRHTACLLL